MKKAFAVLLALCMFYALCSGMAVSAKTTPSRQTEQNYEEEVQDVTPNGTMGQTNSKLYVRETPAAGLDRSVAVSFDLTGTKGTLYLPGKVDAGKLFFSWNGDRISVSRDNRALENGAVPVAPAGKSVSFQIRKGDKTSNITVKTVQGSRDVEPMFLEIDEELGTIKEMNKDKKHKTHCYGSVAFDGIQDAMSIRGRGNSTWKLSKKPYNISLYTDSSYEKGKKEELIPGATAKQWSLLSNYFDNSLMRNKIAMDLADNLGIGLKARFVDLYMNGKYLGNYTMTPKTDYQAPDGGYFLENDNYLDTESGTQFAIPGMFEIAAPMGVKISNDGYFSRINVKDIGKEAVAQGETVETIEAWFQKVWAAIEDYDSEEYQNYLDMDSWAKMFLMYEVSKTYDCYAGSLFMHRDGLTADDKLIAGPAWDYDVTFGRTLHKFFVGISEPTQLNAEGWYNDSIGLMAIDQPISLLQELGKHKSFLQHVAIIYNDYLWAFQDLPHNVDRQAVILRESALMNNAKYGTHSLCAEYVVAPKTMRALGTSKYKLNYEVTTDWESYVRNLRDYCDKRVLWLTDHLYVEKPAGTIQKKINRKDEPVLSVELTAGKRHAKYQWQSSKDGLHWTDLEKATKDDYKPAGNSTLQYRCVVRNLGDPIRTFHGKQTRAASQTILGPVSLV